MSGVSTANGTLRWRVADGEWKGDPSTMDNPQSIIARPQPAVPPPPFPRPLAADAVERMTVEHAGMAEELLRVYEQLGIVFEVTRKLPEVQHESEVLDLFADCLRRSFAGRTVLVVPAGERPTAAAGPVGSSPVSLSAVSDPPWIQALIDRAKARRAVVVEPVPVSAAEQEASAPGLPDLGRSPACAGPPDCERSRSGRPSSACEHAQADADRQSGGRAGEVMIGPVFAGPDDSAGSGFVASIVLIDHGGGFGFCSSDMLLLESLTMFCGDLIRNHRLVRELREMSFNVVRALVGAVDQKDRYTSGHSLRVGYFAVLLGGALGLSETERRMLRWSALLHDVGKIGIRDDVLKKESTLTAQETSHIREHPVRSYEIVQEVPQLQGALDGVLHHHERFDGGGYPEGLAAEAIPLQARIIQIADIFDALTSNRSYRGAYPWEQALRILREEAGKTVDPHLQSVFEKVLREKLSHDPNAWDTLIALAGGEEPRSGKVSPLEVARGGRPS